MVEGLGRDYGGSVALASLDLSIRPGTAVALIGRNGSGKTTALTMMAGRLEPTRGKVVIGGVDVHTRGGSEAVRSLVSFVPDAPALYPDLTVIDHLDLVGMAHGVDDLDDKIDGLLERFGLEDKDDLLPRELSRGMRQKAQLSCALLRPFGVLMLDEPVGGLDPGSRNALRDLLVEAKDEGAVVIFSTHYFAFAEDLADRVLVLSDGEVAVDGSYREVVASGKVKELGLE
ncbi:MAG: ABC transporter ATP-binding protein [Acidimicrobiia bacterium]|nr:ABC transporter ATP-binding protein [Acidimicrobiia bacterium]